MEIKRGDIVGRISYGKDILFYVDRIIKTNTNKDYAILKGVQFRVEADAELSDLEKMNKDEIEKLIRGNDTKIKERISKSTKELFTKKTRNQETSALILHLDGDKRYAQKSSKYYNKLGLNAIVKNIPENRQPQIIRGLIRKYNPDILVITRT